jgi:hypothetical protein
MPALHSVSEDHYLVLADHRFADRRFDLVDDIKGSQCTT